MKNSSIICAHLFEAFSKNCSNVILLFPFGLSDILLITINGILSNLDIQKRHEILPLHKLYNPDIYKKYDNYDAIEVSEVSSIPKDYSGKMGVTISFMEVFNPEQFELIGSSDISDTLVGIQPLGVDWIRKYRQQGGTGHYTANMKSVGFSGDGKNKIIFSRLIIKNKNPERSN